MHKFTQCSITAVSEIIVRKCFVFTHKRCISINAYNHIPETLGVFVVDAIGLLCLHLRGGGVNCGGATACGLTYSLCRLQRQ